MAVRKNTKDPTKAIFPEISLGGDLSARLRNISEQTGLSPQSLIYKWILQEETFIGFMQFNKKSDVGQPQASTDAALPKKSVAETVPVDPGNPDSNKNTPVKRAKQLKKEGMTLKEIAKSLNEEKIPTLSGVGEWYASSVARLLNSKK